MDYMRPDIVALLRGSDSSYVRELIGMDPVAVFRWAMLRAAIRAMAVLREAGRLRAERAEKAAGMWGRPGPPSGVHFEFTFQWQLVPSQCCAATALPTSGAFLSSIRNSTTRLIF